MIDGLNKFKRVYILIRSDNRLPFALLDTANVMYTF